MDQDNIAVASQLIVPPAMLEAAGEDTKVTSTVARKMHLIALHTVHEQMKNPNVPLGQKLTYLDHVAKVGGVYPSQTAQTNGLPGSGFGVNIIFSSDTPPPNIRVTPTQQHIVDVEALPVVTGPARTNKMMANLDAAE